jgi:hypothetical protein
LGEHTFDELCRGFSGTSLEALARHLGAEAGDDGAA